jgi:hypothetical protein
MKATRRRMSLRLGKTYRVGSSGVRITWRDDETVTTHPPYSVITFSRVPLKVEGRLYRVTRAGALGYEAPRLKST